MGRAILIQLFNRLIICRTAYETSQFGDRFEDGQWLKKNQMDPRVQSIRMEVSEAQPYVTEC